MLYKKTIICLFFKPAFVEKGVHFLPLIQLYPIKTIEKRNNKKKEAFLCNYQVARTWLVLKQQLFVSMLGLALKIMNI